MPTRSSIIRLALLALLALATATCSPGNKGGGGGLTAAEIDALVSAAVFTGDALTTPTTLYRYPSALASGDVLSTITPYDPGDPDADFQVETLFTAGAATTYFYFVDYFTGEQYSHPVEYIVVDGTTGALTRFDGEWWPLLNEEAIFFTAAQVTQPQNIVRRIPLTVTPSVDPPDWNDFGIKEVAASRTTFKLAAADPETQHALVINGIAEDDSIRPAAEAAAAQAEAALKGSGVYEGVTKIDYKDVPGPDPQVRARTMRNQIMKFLADFTAPPGSNLTIYVVCHGTPTGLVLGPQGRNSDRNIVRSDFAAALKKLSDPPKSIRIKMITQACWGGDFVNALQKQLKVGISAAGSNSASAVDVDPGATAGPLEAPGPDSNPGDTGPEFSSGYWEDYSLIYQGLKNDQGRRDRLQQLSIQTGIPQEELILYAAFVTAVEKDATAKRDKPRRYPEKFPHPDLEKDILKATDPLQMQNVPDWIEDLIGRPTVAK